MKAGDIKVVVETEEIKKLVIRLDGILKKMYNYKISITIISMVNLIMSAIILIGILLK